MTTSEIRWRPLVALALVCGLVQVAVGVVLYLSGVYFEAWALRLIMLLQAVYIVAGNWWYGRRVLGGQTSYPKALLVGVVISIGVGVVYAIYNLVSVGFVYSHFLEDMIQAEFARASAGMDAAQSAKLLQSLRAELTLAGLAVGNFVAATRFGVLLSVLLSLGFLRLWRRGRQAAAVQV